MWLRPRFLPELVRTYSIFDARIPNPLLGDFIVGGGGPGIGGIYDGAGHLIKGGQTICPGVDVSACVAEFGRGAHNLEIYQPASRYWLFQGIETALFVGLAALLLVAAVWWIRRRLA